MKKFILGTKIGMTQIFAEDGTCTPVTVVQAGPCAVVQKKSEETDGYCAVRIGFGETELNKLNKPERGVFEKLDMKKGYKHLKEFRAENADEFEVGQEISVAAMFSDGDAVDVRGTSKGKGYSGTIKRYGNKIVSITHVAK